MAAADERRLDSDGAVPRSAEHDADRDARPERQVTANIDRIADKVKGLLRSDG